MTMTDSTPTGAGTGGAVQPVLQPAQSIAQPVPITVSVDTSGIKQAIAEVLSEPLTAKNLTADAKSFLTSKTLWGIVMMAVATEAQQLGYHFTTGDQSDLVNDITAFFQLGGMVLATIGRITATKGLK